MTRRRVVLEAPPAEAAPFRVPTMAEVREAEGAAGLVAASTFAGAGGSSIGYRLAGFRVTWASEFYPPAADAYACNFPSTAVDRRDVRELTGADVLAGAGVDELDLLDGSPPCQSFSMAGRRSKGWGRVVAHADGTTQRSDDLFAEFVRLVAEARPRAFVAENVAALAFGAARGHLREVLDGLRVAGYRVGARILDARWLGVPQIRRRLFIVGAREDLGREPAFPEPRAGAYSVADACPWLAGARIVDVGGYHDGRVRPCSLPAYTVTASGMSSGGRDQALLELPDGTRRRMTVAEARRLMTFPDDYDLADLGDGAAWARLGNAVPPLMARAVAEAVRDRMLA